ncbi:MAG: PD-(D/E)XK nuclease family protein [Nanoarchaeota archaeon]|nr:PD-(D/E)XK nuclease family protein [Nanoarchaeota archaeon]
MTTYSHSRISTYENCPYQYKLRYVDKIEPEIAETIEIFMGKRVHETLEKLYKDKKFKKLVSKATLLKFYKDNWEKEYSDDILVVKEGLTGENYRKMGIKFIEDYYNKYKPFDQLTILGLETQDRMTLKDGNQWHVRIDKFACDNKGNYYVCDYKTNASMKDQEEADADRQLAMYSIWVKDKFKDAKSVKLVWHMLAFNKEAISERSEEQLEKLQDETIAQIKQIERAEKEKDFPTHITALCNYCGFKSQCPSFKHQIEVEAKEDIKEFKEDDGVKLVDEFSEVKLKKKEIEEKEEKLKSDLIEFAKQKGIDIVYGSNMKAGVKEFDKIVMPEDPEEKEKFIKLMKDKGIYEECSMICYPKLNSKVLKGDIDKEIKNKVQIEKDFRISLSKRKDVEEE